MVKLFATLALLLTACTQQSVKGTVENHYDSSNISYHYDSRTHLCFAFCQNTAFSMVEVACSKEVIDQAIADHSR